MHNSAAATEPAVTKLQDLNNLLRGMLPDGLVIAYSGGVDSTFLLWAAEQERKRSGGRLVAVTTESESLSEAERLDVTAFITANGIDHLLLESKEMLDPLYVVNDKSRCFHCKSELFRICREVADEQQFKWIAYGYNASDRGDDRPGQLAAMQNSIQTPLADAEMSKSDIRQLMRENGVPMADKPASPCLSSRLMTGVQITPGKLRDVEAIEAILREGGVRVFRVRFHETASDKFLRIEVAPEDMERGLHLRKELTAAGASRGFRWVTLDLNGYVIGGGNLGAP